MTDADRIMIFRMYTNIVTGIIAVIDDDERAKENFFVVNLDIANDMLADLGADVYIEKEDDDAQIRN